MNTLVLPLMLAATLAGLSMLLLVGGVFALRQRSPMRERLDQFVSYEELSDSVLEDELRKPFSQRVLVPLARWLASPFIWIWPQTRMNAMQRRLNMAGNPGGLGALEFLGMRVLLMLLLGGMSLAYGYAVRYPVTSTSLIMLGLMFFCGFSLPNFWLGRKITQRQGEIINSLPDALDMLLITTEAGMSFESGLQEITTKWSHALANEFTRVLRDIGMGQTRREALAALSERTGVSDIVSFVGALNQADELGVSIGRVLRAQADDMRTRRRQSAYERANKTPVKMMFPLVFLIFPSIFAVLLGPALVQLMERGGI